MIEFDNVTKKYNEKKVALDDVSLKIDDGEFVFVTGESGAGKSTIARLMMYETRSDSGTIRVNGFNLSKIHKRDIQKLRRSMGVVFQDYKLIEDMNVFDNVAFALRAIGAPTKLIRNRVPYVLDIVGLAKCAQVYPKQLSGGEQQRVALARAFVNNPSLIIADEPTSNVDPKYTAEIMYLLQKINEKGTTVVVMTHDQHVVNRMQKRVIALRNGVVISDKIGGYVL